MSKDKTFNLLTFCLWTQRGRVARALDRPDHSLDLFSVVTSAVRGRRM